MDSTHYIHTHTTCSTSEIHPESSVPEHSHLSVRQTIHVLLFQGISVYSSVLVFPVTRSPVPKNSGSDP